MLRIVPVSLAETQLALWPNEGHVHDELLELRIMGRNTEVTAQNGESLSHVTSKSNEGLERQELALPSVHGAASNHVRGCLNGSDQLAQQ